MRDFAPSACGRRYRRPSNRATAHYNLGVALKAKGQQDEAIAEYRKAIQIDPKHVSAQYNLGVALANKGRVDQAIAAYDKAIALDPKHEGQGKTNHLVSKETRR